MRTLCFEGDFKRRMAWYKEFCHEKAEGVLDEFLKRFCNHWLEDEYEVQSGAGWYERNERRQDRRNGHYERAIITRRGMIKVKVPRGERGRYEYSLFKKYERRSQEFDDVVVEALLLGHSGRKASQFFKKLLGAGTVSHDTALRTLRRFDGEVQQWLKRPMRDEAVVLVWSTTPWPEEKPVITTIGVDGVIVIGFDHRVLDDPDNPYGMDFIVFGNLAFSHNSQQYLTPTTDMDYIYLPRFAGLCRAWQSQC